MKKKITFLVTGILIAFLTVQGQTPPTVGDGSIGNPYEIANLENLLWLSTTQSEWVADKYFIQTNDIDASSSSIWDDGNGGIAEGFSPIGSELFPFLGSYNGQDYTISGLTINRQAADNIGMFGVTNTASLSNISLVDINITGQLYVGGLVGSSTMTNIANSYSTGNISGLFIVGGLVGVNDGGVITNSFSTANVQGQVLCGGLAGVNTPSSIVANSYSSGSISGGQDVGGLVGLNDGGVITNSFSTANVQGQAACGGLAGENTPSSIVANSYSSGSISGDDGVGGLIGNNEGDIFNSYSIGNVNGTTNVGGLIGMNQGGTISKSFWNTETSGQATSPAAIGKTTAEMHALCTYIDGADADWDFVIETTNGTENIWGMNASENGGYPFLAWQGYEHTENCCDIIDLVVPETPTLEPLTGECLTVVTPTTTDNCAITINGTTSDPTEYTSDGTYTITWTFDDGNGNSTTAQQTVIVDDVTAPVTPTLADVTGECSATATAPTTTDNCAGTVTGTTSDPLTYTEQGTYTITWTFDDGNGNSTTAQQTVIVDDVTAPVTPTLADVTGECSATAVAPTTTDNCAGTVTGTTSDPTEYTEQGTYTITWTFDDGNGNSTTAEQTVIVDDVTAPVTPTLADVTDECSVTAVAPTTTDNCAGTVTGTTSDPTEYTEQGTYTITWTFDDGNGNSTTAEQTVIVDDVTAPETPTLADVTDDCSATATAPTTTDNCAGTVTGTTSDPTEYTEQGTYTITWTFDDGNGNSTTAEQTVIVDDVTAPETPTLADVTDDCSATATAPTTTDNCAGTVTGTTSDPTEYTEQGTYTITWTFDDGNGNSTTAEQTVIVDDVTAPETPTLADVTDDCSATAVAPTTTDNCAGTVTGTTTDPTEYTEQGTYTITWTFDDGNGNSTTAEQTVIVDDVTAPVTPTLADVTGECSATATAPTTTDNCAGTVTGTTSDPLTYTEQGTYTITWTFDDGNGNTVDVDQNVVIEDATNPTITCLEDQTVYADNTYTVQGTEFDPVETDDNCEVASIENDFNNTATLENAQLPVGTTTINWTIIDIAGNENTCSFDVTVNTNVGISDITLKDISIYPNPTNGIINLESKNNIIQKITVSDITGKEIIVKTQIQQNEILDLSNFESNIYIISIQTDKKVFSKKIIKK